MISFKSIIKGNIILFLLFPEFAHSQASILPATPVAPFSHPAKRISADLFGAFFEDLSYAADGGLYAELIQNRSFEYSASDRKGWNSLTNWEYTTEGFGYGTISVETRQPINANNPHYVVLNIDDPGQNGVGITNLGYDGIRLKKGERYNFSAYINQISSKAIPVEVKLCGRKGEVYSVFKFNTSGRGWRKYTGSMSVKLSTDSAVLTLVARQKSKLALDEISLFPQGTFKNENNGLRADLAQAIADLKPKFVRFPGGCLVHGDGVNNIYRWKNTVGPVENRIQQRNIWSYHQSVGLGFYEYFRFCEDIGAKPLPIIAAGVSCQNSGGTWAIGSTGQKALPSTEMKSYIQDILDLIEYANGPVNSTWGAKRAAAGHPKPFHLQYIGIGNEDKQTDAFRSRFKMIYDELRTKHPEITIVGTVGPSPNGEDYNLGWDFANRLAVPVVDEHFYETPQWFLDNNNRYDNYSRARSHVYIGEYASQGTKLINALSEAAFMTSLERNGDVVKMASYAPLLANLKHTSWNPNLIYFNNDTLVRTVNYYVQQLFSVNEGDTYIPNIISFERDQSAKDSTLASSCVRDSKTGDVILKIVNAGPTAAVAKVNLSLLNVTGDLIVSKILTGNPNDQNSIDRPAVAVPISTRVKLTDLDSFLSPAYSLTVIRFLAKSNQHHVSN
ncbi:alpha-L-arabinofuranosidase C-terminal domain-containing protein [Mucilaginibacter sp. X5P1]|uniref:alpha-L-arabinofuranosidase C-terminal domain-containing protein n=1 Tax=Mucilaginibacter sp. X5P1 TaxID=2723088 RepID=UPI0016227678|nr:alpha-L-arabinofuranosidase C-terminal domain-containing protein [Mucilaginibacter sp. X5P1]MBB6140180.1 alpha-L-arabinofuranosidase [Mucilaginibacter sp. X5P1]